jgi:hypothetical protein
MKYPPLMTAGSKVVRRHVDFRVVREAAMQR